jgi:hypothetical protein
LLTGVKGLRKKVKGDLRPAFNFPTQKRESKCPPGRNKIQKTPGGPFSISSY